MKNQTQKYIATLELPTTKTVGQGGKLICDNCVVEIPITASLFLNRGKYELRLNKSPYFNFKFKKLKEFLALANATIKYKV